MEDAQVCLGIVGGGCTGMFRHCWWKMHRYMFRDVRGGCTGMFAVNSYLFYF